MARRVWLATLLGACLDAGAVTLSPKNPGPALALFWLALSIPFAAQAASLLSPRISERLRQTIISLIGLYPSVLYRMSSPLVLTDYDEHLHERQLMDLLHGGGLFAPNPMLSVGPYYPGLELLTGVTIRVTGISSLLGTILIPLLCRWLFVLLMYYCAKLVLRDVRFASLAVVFYAVSPQFYRFNSEFSYQTLALTLGLGAVYLTRMAQLSQGGRRRRLVVAASVAVAGMVITHHITSWLFAGFLVVWAVAASRPDRRPVAQVAGVAVGAILVWSIGIATQLAGYLGPVFSAAAAELGATASGSSQGHVFSSSAAHANPEWDKLLLTFYAVACAIAAGACGLRLLIWAYRRRNRCYAVIGLGSICYPATLASHYVSAAAEIGDRASTFLFFPVALAVAATVAGTSGSYVSRLRRVPFKMMAPAIAVVSIVYLGGVALGTGPDFIFLPGPYLVAADARTQDSYTLAAVEWAADNIPPDSRVVADRTPADLLGAKGLWPVTEPSNGLEPAWLYFSPSWTSYQTEIVRGLHVQYIYVDSRLADSLPSLGFYFYPGETSVPRRITVSGVAKFAHVPGLRPVYRVGPVAIYSTAGLGVTPGPTSFTGYAAMGLGAAGDFVLGVIVFSLGFCFRRRFCWVARLVRDAGTVGTSVALMGLVILLGAGLFELRAMPGPGFTVGFLVGYVVIGFAKLKLRRSISRLLRSVAGSGALDPVLLFTVLLVLASVAVSILDAYRVDVVTVQSLLHGMGA